MVIQSLLKCHKNVEMIIIENNYFFAGQWSIYALNPKTT